jgi:hypothetical protein
MNQRLRCVVRGRAPWGVPLARAAAAALLLAAAPAFAGTAEASAQARAGTILNLLGFVEWPTSSGHGRVVCADPADPQALALKTAARQGVRGRQWDVIDLLPGESARACDALLLDAALRATLPQAQLRDGPAPAVLLLAAGPCVPGDGVAIHLVDDGERVGFDVHMAPMRRAGLRLSSRLLRLARRVEE